MKILGIDVKVHWSLWLFIAYYAWVGSQAKGAYGALITCGTFAAVFSFVLMHEFGHCLAARSYGIGTKCITLLPLGGLAQIERMPEDPKQELFITVCGPLVNVVLAFLFSAIMAFFPWTADIVLPFFYFNVIMVAFNLLPAFPMDGGRILRSVTAIVTGDRALATRWAVRIGKVCSLGFIVLGVLYSHFMLALIGLFIFLSSSAEEKTTTNGFVGPDGDVDGEEEE